MKMYEEGMTLEPGESAFVGVFEGESPPDRRRFDVMRFAGRCVGALMVSAACIAIVAGTLFGTGEVRLACSIPAVLLSGLYLFHECRKEEAMIELGPLREKA